MMKYISILIVSFAMLIAKPATSQQVFLSATSGDWNTLSTWSEVFFVPFPPFFAVSPATSTPNLGDQVNILDPHVVSISGTEVCDVLTVASSTGASSIVIDAAGSLTCDSITVNPTGTGSSNITNNGTVTSIKTLFVTAAAGVVGTIDNNGTMLTTTLAFSEAGGTSVLNINAGGRFTTNDVDVTNTSPAGTVIDMSSGDGQMRLNGSFVGSGLATFNGGSAGSRIEYGGTSSQIISASNPNFIFDEIRVLNTVGASLDGPLTLANINGDFRTASNGIINQAGFDISLPNRIFVNGNGTFNADANITTVGNIVTNGVFNQVGASLMVGNNLNNNGVFNASGTIDVGNNFNIQAGGTFVSTGCNINVERNWVNNGTYTYSIGDVVALDGLSNNSNFTGTTEFYELHINKTGRLATVGNGDVIDIKSVLDINDGTLRVNGTGVLTLLSDASGTANMANIDAGSFTGNMVVRRFINKTVQGYVTFASPVSGTTLNSWHDGGIGSGQEFIFSGFTGSDYPAFPFNNAYDYDESTSGTDRNAGFVEADNITDPTGVANGFKSHYIWADAVSYNMSVIGVPNTGSVSIPLDYNSAGGAANDGWNLIGNPFPCTIDWEVVNNSLVNVEDFYSVYSYETGNFASYEGGVGSLNGGTQYIPSCQGIWVQAIANTSLTIDESAKAADQDPVFIKSALDVLRISISSGVNGFSDEAIVMVDSQYNNNAEIGDRAKWMTFDSINSPTLYTESYDAEKMAVNKFSNSGDLDIPLMAVSGTGATGLYTLEFNYPATFMANSCIMLEDLHTSSMIDLRQNNTYSYTTSDTTTTPRFIIHLGKNFTAEPLSASCDVNSDGSIEVQGDNITGASFTLLDNSNTLLHTETANTASLSFDNLLPGTYYLVSDYTGNCGLVDTIEVVVDALNNVTADFVASSTMVLLDVDGEVSFTNSSIGNTFTWDFGDGTTSTDQNPIHTYITPGVYNVTLISENSLGCQETAVQTIEVTYSSVVSVESQGFENVTLTIADRQLMLDLTSVKDSELILSIFDISGKEIRSMAGVVSGSKLFIDVNDLSAGVYIVHLRNDNLEYSDKVIVD